MIQDKERLYEENINLKNTINLLQQENNKLRSRNNCMEKDLTKYEKMVESQVVSTHNRNRVMVDNTQLMHLRQQLKQTNKCYEQQTLDIQQFKKSIKTTKIQELEVLFNNNHQIEKEVNMNELERLSTLLNSKNRFIKQYLFIQIGFRENDRKMNELRMKYRFQFKGLINKIEGQKDQVYKCDLETKELQRQSNQLKSQLQKE